MHMGYSGIKIDGGGFGKGGWGGFPIHYFVSDWINVMLEAFTYLIVFNSRTLQPLASLVWLCENTASGILLSVCTVDNQDIDPDAYDHLSTSRQLSVWLSQHSNIYFRPFSWV